MSASTAVATQTTVPAPLLFGESKYFGYPAAPWHSDAQQVTEVLTELLAKNDAPSPSLQISSGAAIDQVVMTLNGSTLTTYGNGGGGSPSTLDADHLQNIVQISVWGTDPSRYSTQRLGQITFTFTATSGFPPATFGKDDDILLGALDANGGTLVGFTGNSGAMVDGLAFLMTPPV